MRPDSQEHAPLPENWSDPITANYRFAAIVVPQKKMILAVQKKESDHHPITKVPLLKNRLEFASSNETINIRPDHACPFH